MGKIAAVLFSLIARPERSRRVNGQWSIVLLLTLLFSLLTLTLLARPAFADHASPVDNPAEPSPAPCTNAIGTYQLTDNYVTGENGDAPYKFTTPKDPPDRITGTPGQSVDINISTTFEVDFAKLQAVFGATNSNYLEGNFQDDPHQKENVLNLNSQDFNKYQGSAVKIAPKTLIDPQRVKYVEYIWQHPHLPEASAKYTDIENSNKDDPVTIYQMITELNFPNPPEPPPPGADEATIKQWQETWGKYWPKIPTNYSEFYKGYLEFRAFSGNTTFDWLKNGTSPNGFCPKPKVLRTPIEFVMPEFKRTVSLSGQLNQIVVPCAAQSFRHGSGPNPDDPDNCLRSYTQTAQAPGNVLSGFLQKCKEILTGASKTLIKKLRGATQTSFRILNPVKTASATTPAPTPTPVPCIKVLAEGKEGTAPFCAVPTYNSEDPPQLQIQPGECSNPNPNDPNNLNKGQNVRCTFTVTGQVSLNIPDDPTNSANNPISYWKQENPNWNDPCDDNGDGTYTCITTIRVFPVFRIPFLAEIWNNTLYSNEDDQQGVISPQKSGRPGIYSNFIPKAIYDVLFPKPGSEQAKKGLDACLQNGNGQECKDFLSIPGVKYCALSSFGMPDPYAVFEKCTATLIGKNLPGEVATGVLGAKSSVLGATSNDAKQRFICATDCSKFFTRDISLKPRALQKEQGIDKQ